MNLIHAVKRAHERGYQVTIETSDIPDVVYRLTLTTPDGDKHHGNVLQFSIKHMGEELAIGSRLHFLVNELDARAARPRVTVTESTMTFCVTSTLASVPHDGTAFGMAYAFLHECGLCAEGVVTVEADVLPPPPGEWEFGSPVEPIFDRYFPKYTMNLRRVHPHEPTGSLECCRINERSSG